MTTLGGWHDWRDKAVTQIVKCLPRILWCGHCICQIWLERWIRFACCVNSLKVLNWWQVNFWTLWCSWLLQRWYKSLTNRSLLVTAHSLYRCRNPHCIVWMNLTHFMDTWWSNNTIYLTFGNDRLLLVRKMINLIFSSTFQKCKFLKCFTNKKALFLQESKKILLALYLMNHVFAFHSQRLWGRRRCS